ncbi:MAG: hypothetical protein CMJ83_22930 [Planctomycetes bacterium]|nr:hypothetical protein [Planctomycetota bacterium]
MRCITSSILVSVLVPLACSAAPAQVPQTSVARSPSWWVRVSGRGESAIRVSADGKRTQRCDALPGRDALPTLDGKRWVKQGFPVRRKRAELMIGELGADARRFTTNPDSDDAMPAWSPRGDALAWCRRDAKKRWQVHFQPLDAAEARILTKFEGNVVEPVLSGTGLIAWIERPIPKRFMKMPPGNVVLSSLDGKTRHVIGTLGSFMDLGFSPDGKLLMVHRPAALDFYDVATRRKVRTFDLTEIPQVGWAHGAWRVAWRPDSRAFACRITFLGGRMEGTEIYGDHQIFLFSLDPNTKPLAVTLPDEFEHHRVLFWERR